MITSPILVVVAYHPGDADRANSMLEWIAELGGARPHSCLLVSDPGISTDSKKAIAAVAKKSFDFVASIPAGVRCQWKPNEMFLSAAKWINETCKMPWLWLEPDAVPLKEGWLDAIAEEYESSPKLMLGPIVRQKGQPGLPEAYLNGTAVYPANAWDLVYKDVSERLKKENVAWDIETAGMTVPRSKHTPLIQHYWGMKDMPPIFVEKKTDDSPKNFVTMDFIQKDAVVFHRSKGGELISILRKRASKK